MRAFIPSETALVLGGGGAKGAYEVGAIAALDALAGKLERAKSNLAAFDGLDNLEKKLSAARDAAALENARAEKRRAALGQLDGELTALEQSLAALGGAEAENVSLKARAEQLARGKRPSRSWPRASPRGSAGVRPHGRRRSVIFSPTAQRSAPTPSATTSSGPFSTRRRACWPKG